MRFCSIFPFEKEVRHESCTFAGFFAFLNGKARCGIESPLPESRTPACPGAAHLSAPSQIPCPLAHHPLRPHEGDESACFLVS